MSTAPSSRRMGDSTTADPLEPYEEDVFVASLEDPAQKYANMAKMARQGSFSSAGSAAKSVPAQEEDETPPSFFGSRLMWLGLCWSILIIVIIIVAVRAADNDDGDDRQADPTPAPSVPKIEVSPTSSIFAPSAGETDAPGVAPVAPPTDATDPPAPTDATDPPAPTDDTDDTDPPAPTDATDPPVPATAAPSVEGVPTTAAPSAEATAEVTPAATEPVDLEPTAPTAAAVPTATVAPVAATLAPTVPGATPNPTADTGPPLIPGAPTAGPVDETGVPTAAPVAVTTPPVAETEAPVVETEAPTISPAALTVAPVAATAPPVDGTPAPVADDIPVTPSPVAVTPVPQPVDLFDLLPSTSQEALTDPTSPQAFAFLFVNYDPSVGSRSDAELVQRFALATLYFGLGRDWTEGEVLPSQNECDWFAATGSFCNSDNQMEALLLENNNLEMGPIPAEIGLLTALKQVDMSSNFITGTIPTNFGQLTMLELLNLSGNELIMGTIPTELSSIETLQTLDLTGLSFVTGVVPEGVCDVENLSFDCDPASLCGCDSCACVSA